MSFSVFLLVQNCMVLLTELLLLLLGKIFCLLCPLFIVLLVFGILISDFLLSDLGLSLRLGSTMLSSPCLPLFLSGHLLSMDLLLLNLSCLSLSLLLLLFVFLSLFLSNLPLSFQLLELLLGLLCHLFKLFRSGLGFLGFLLELSHPVLSISHGLFRLLSSELCILSLLHGLVGDFLSCLRLDLEFILLLEEFLASNLMLLHQSPDLLITSIVVPVTVEQVLLLMDWFVEDTIFFLLNVILNHR